MLLALFALYPLSVGPATRLVTSPESDETAARSTPDLLASEPVCLGWVRARMVSELLGSLNYRANAEVRA